MSKKNNIVQQPVVVEDGAIYVLQPGISVFVKTADMCSAIGVSNQWVGQLTSQGILSRTRTPHGSLYELNGNMSNYCGQ